MNRFRTKKFNITAEEVKKIFYNDFTKAEKKKLSLDRKNWIYLKGLYFRKVETDDSISIEAGYCRLCSYGNSIYEEYVTKIFNAEDVIPEELRCCDLISYYDALADQINEFFKYIYYNEYSEIVDHCNIYWNVRHFLRNSIYFFRNLPNNIKYAIVRIKNRKMGYPDLPF